MKDRGVLEKFPDVQFGHLEHIFFVTFLMNPELLKTHIFVKFKAKEFMGWILRDSLQGTST